MSKTKKNCRGNYVQHPPKMEEARIAPGGLLWVSDWNSLQQPMASALLTAISSDYMLSSRTAKITCDGDSYSPLDLRQFAMSQILKEIGAFGVGQEVLWATCMELQFHMHAHWMSAQIIDPQVQYIVRPYLSIYCILSLHSSTLDTYN
ncbi:hypothetical protein POM88_016701 [Heracleum sosnowskyi]|uniref:Uncharacterized protein n=1 Tax=Heracleum sosnowskyi TaxID=360622 RepID=A0AAD8INW5_9APIA|nr:hypothetical protein POM88_016701 [Heracleum sosnowskyi]